jgi:hypothetical protein
MFRKTATKLKSESKYGKKKFQPKKKRKKKVFKTLKFSPIWKKKKGHLATKKPQKTLKFRQFEKKIKK